MPGQRHLPPAPERGPLRGRWGRRVPARAGACPLPALRGASRLPRLHPGAHQAAVGRSRHGQPEQATQPRGEGPQGWPRDPVGSGKGRQLGPLLGGESQVGEGLESGLDIVMTLHVAGAGEPSLTSLHQRGLIRLDAGAQEQVFRPAGSRSSSHASAIHLLPFHILIFPGSSFLGRVKGASRAPDFHPPPLPWALKSQEEGDHLPVPTAPSPLSSTEVTEGPFLCSSELVPAPGPVRLGGGRVTPCPSLDLGDWVSPTWTTQSGTTAPKVSSAGQAEPVDLPGCGREAGLDQGSVSRCWGAGARRPRGRFSWALLPPSSQDPFCEWHQSTSRKGDAACSRRGRGRGALKSPEECPPLCSQ